MRAADLQGENGVGQQRGGLRELILERLAHRFPHPAVRARYLRDIEGYLGYCHRQENAEWLQSLTPCELAGRYLGWLARQPGVVKRDLASARRAVTFLYREVFGTPLSRS